MIRIELTDTFGGETNYSWIHRMEIKDGDLSNRQILKRVRNKFGITGKIRKVMDTGDFLRYDIAGACVCILIYWEY